MGDGGSPRDRASESQQLALSRMLSVITSEHVPAQADGPPGSVTSSSRVGLAQAISGSAGLLGQPFGGAQAECV